MNRCVFKDVLAFPPIDPRYTQDRDYSLEGNRPRVATADECAAMNHTTKAKAAESGLNVRRQL